MTSTPSAVYWLTFDRKQKRPYPAHVQVDRTRAVLVEVDLFLEEIVGEDLDILQILEERVAAKRRSLRKRR